MAGAVDGAVKGAQGLVGGFMKVAPVLGLTATALSIAAIGPGAALANVTDGFGVVTEALGLG